MLTKLDIMDKGTDARAVLDGQSVRLKHGWVAVVNRGQKDINDNLSMEVGFLPTIRSLLLRLRTKPGSSRGDCASTSVGNSNIAKSEC